MLRLTSLLLFVTVFMAGCVHDPTIPTNTPDPVDNVPEPNPQYLIGSFNLHNFGPSRIENQEAFSRIVNIARRYDLLVLQEIRDVTATAPTELLSAINAAGQAQYALLLSSRAGRFSRKEQYGLLYRLDRVSVLDFYDYDDGPEPDQDGFSYEPAVAYVDLAGETFSIITLHADPDNVIFELNRLLPVYQDAVARTGDDDTIILGDLNADCGSLANRDEPMVKLLSDPRFQWLISSDADTTVRASTNCAYDRIITTLTLDHALRADSAQVYDFGQALGLTEDEALEVSDHYPVELTLDIQPTWPALLSY